MKKIIALILALVMIVPGQTIIASNEGAISVESVSAKKGSEVEVGISISNNPGIASASLTIGYDSSALKLIGVVDGGILGANYHTTNYDLNPYYLTWANDTASVDYTANGKLATLKFQVLDRATVGNKYPITVSYDYDNYDIYNVNVEPVKLAMVNGDLTVLGDEKETGIVSASVTLSKDFTLNVDAIVGEDVKTPKMIFTRDEKIETIEGLYDNDSKMWYFRYTGIKSQSLTDKIDMVLIDDGESEIDSIKDYTLRDYCDSLYNSSPEELKISNEKFALLKTLLADMLEYGAASQKYINYKTNDLANSLSWVASNKTQNPVCPKIDKTTVIRSESEEDRINSASLLLSNEIQMTFKFNAKKATKIVINDGYEDKEILISSLVKDDYYRAISEGIPASSFGKVYTISLCDEQKIYHQITYSVNSYTASMWNSINENLSVIVKAIRNYGASATAYIA